MSGVNKKCRPGNPTVAEQGRLSSENRDTIREAKLDYLIAHPLRRDADSKYLLDRCGESLRQARQEDRKVVLAAAMYAERPDDHFAVPYDPEIAQTSREGRQRRLAKADAAIDEILERLRKAKDPTVRKRGRKLTTEGAQLKIHDYLRDHDLGRLYGVRLDKSMPLGLSVVANTEARTFEESIDGILIVEGSRRDFTATQIVERSKSLAEIERS